MGKVVIESGRCPSGCRTVCQRYKSVGYDIVEGEMDDFELVPITVDYGSFRKPKPDSGEE